MKRIATMLARLSLKGYSLFLVVVLWLIGTSISASGSVPGAVTMYGVITEYGPPQPPPQTCCCAAMLNKTLVQTVSNHDKP